METIASISPFSIDRKIIKSSITGIPCLFLGPPGVGKTAAIKSLQQKGYHVHLLAGGSLNMVDFSGIPVANRDKGTADSMMPAWYKRLVEDCENHDPSEVVLFLDEITTSKPQVAAAMLSLLQGGNVGNWRVPHGVIMAAAGNRREDNPPIFNFSPVVGNRCAIYQVETPTVNQWLAWADGAGILHDSVAAHLLTNQGDMYHAPKRGDETRPFPSPRSWENACHMANAADTPSEMIEDATACVGPVALNLATIAELMKRVVPFDEIVDDPNGARLPEFSDPAAGYLTVSSMVKNVDSSTALAVWTYVKRLPNDLVLQFSRRAGKSGKKGLFAGISDFMKYLIDQHKETLA